MIGNDIILKYSVLADNTPEYLSNLKEIKVWLRHETIKALQIEPVFTIEGNVITMDVHAGLHKRTGAYRLFIQYKKNNPSRIPNYDSKSIAQLAFTLVETTEEAGGVSNCQELEPITIELSGDVGFGSSSSGSGNVVVDNDSVILVNGKLTVNVVDSDKYDSDEYKSSSRPVSAKQLRIIRELLESDYAKKIDIPDEPDLSVYVKKVDGKGLSENDYTTEEKNKLSLVKAKTDKILSSGSGTRYLSDDGTYKSVDSSSSMIEDEEFIGEYSIAQSEYALYQSSFELLNLPKVSGTASIFKISDRPLGFNIYLEVKSFSVSPVIKTTLASFIPNNYEITKVFVDADLCTKIEVKCVKDTTVDYKAIVQLQYIKDYGDILEFTVTVPEGVDANSVELAFPKLKYNKKVVASLTVDDSYSIYNNFFAVVNKRWVSNEIGISIWTGGSIKYFHHLGMANGYMSSNGYYPDKFIEYSNGAGIKHRFACSVAAWTWDLLSRDEDAGGHWPWISAKEARYMQDFGYSLNYHDISGIGEWKDKNGTTLAPKDVFNNLVSLDAQVFYELTDRIPKIMQGPNGDPNYIYMCRTCPTIQYNMEISNRGTDSICTKFKPFSNTYVLDDKRSKYLVQRDFPPVENYLTDFKNNIVSELGVAEDNRRWLIMGIHRPSQDYDNGGTNIHGMLKYLGETLGAGGSDELWFPSIDEVYEYWFMTYYGKVYKTVDGQKVKFKIHAPCGKNFWFRSISCLLSGISSINGVSVVSSDNCFGTSYAMSNGKLLVNLDFNPELPQRAEKYVSILEADKNKEYAYDDAQYFVNMLKPGVKEPFQARIDALVSKPILNSISINSGATSTENDTVTIAISYSAGTPTQYMLSEKSDLSDGVWTDFLVNPTFVLSSGYGSKTVYAKLRNGFGETSIMSDTINYTEPVLNLTSLLINNGDVSTSNPSVVLSFGYVGTATHYMISANTDFSGASWVAFTANPTFVLDNSTFGTKMVYAKLKNSTVETSAVSDSINLVDPNQIALNSVNINNGDENTSSLNVIVSLGVTNTPTHYRIGETSDLSAVSWQAYTSNQLSFALSGYGLKTVYVQLKNATSTSAVLSDSILAVQPVVLNSILINNADVSTDNKTLSVAISYSGGAPTHYMISESQSFTGASWIAFASSPVSYTLVDAAAGNKTVYVKLKNLVGESVVANDTINLTIKQTKVILANVAAAKTSIDGVGTVNMNDMSFNSADSNLIIYDTDGNAFCYKLDNYKNTAIMKSAFNDKYNNGVDVVSRGNAAYFDAGISIPSNAEYPESMLKPSGVKSIVTFGVKPNTVPETRYCGQRLYGVPVGTYKVRILHSVLNIPEAESYTYKVQNTTITKANTVAPKSLEWEVFDSVEVESDGYLYIGYRPNYNVVVAEIAHGQPIVLIEITKLT